MTTAGHRHYYRNDIADWWCETEHTVTDYCTHPDNTIAEPGDTSPEDAVTDLHLPDDSCCTDDADPERCPGCGQVDPMGEAAWHATDCPVIDLDTVLDTWLDLPADTDAWTLTPHVTCLGGNIVGIEGVLADEYATGVLITVADRDPVKLHPGADRHPGYTVTVCQYGENRPGHDHADDPAATVDSPADLLAAITRLR